MKKLVQLYLAKTPKEVSNQGINYLKISTDLGMHSTAFSFMKNTQNKMQNVQRLRSIYSSNEKQNRSEIMTPALKSQKANDFESSEKEIKETLLSKIKQFRDLIHIYQRKNHSENSILPLPEFKTVLRAIGINIPNSSLQRFVVLSQPIGGTNKPYTEGSFKPKPGQRAVTSDGRRGVKDVGIDAREFLKFYI
mmetsp:Transcript_6866/g.6071  ORF Transcript_6866/g.6071 Transcript_6866/m.6071 type:complete len:193 (+) Transcript_6866:700-1278(+)